MSIRALCSNQADLEARDNEGRTPLMLIAALGMDQYLRALLRFKPELEAADKKGRTAIMHAAIEDRPEHVQKLLKKGAKIKKIPFKIFKEINSEDIALDLVRKGVDIKSDNLKEMWKNKGWSTKALKVAQDSWNKDVKNFLNDTNDLISITTNTHSD